MKKITLDHSAEVLANLAELAISENYSDITFVVQNERIPAHRLLLASRCEYFRALLYGGLAESKQNEIALDVPLIAFKHLIRYIYTGALELKDLEQDDVLNLLQLVHEYGITTVEKNLSEQLSKAISIKNVCAILEVALLLDLTDLTAASYDFIEAQACDVMKHDSFCELKFDTLISILDRECLYVEEMHVFEAIQSWCTHNQPIEDKKNKLYGKVRFTGISQQDLLKKVRPTGVLNSDALLDIIDSQEDTIHLPSRFKPGPNQNVGCSAKETWNGNQANFDLGKYYLLNFVNIGSKNYCYRGYGGYISISVSFDGKTWKELKNSNCNSSNYEVSFTPQVVRYIKFITNDDFGKDISLTAMFKSS